MNGHTIATSEGHRRSSSDKGIKFISNDDPASKPSNTVRPKGANFVLPSFFNSASIPVSSNGNSIFSGHRRRSSGGIITSKPFKQDVSELNEMQLPAESSSNSFLSKKKKSKTPPETLVSSELVRKDDQNEGNLFSANPTPSVAVLQNGKGFEKSERMSQSPIMPFSNRRTSGIQTEFKALHSTKASSIGQADEEDLNAMQENLRLLLSDFNSGKLRAFVNSDTLEKMKNVREQQDRLARLHFDLYSDQEKLGVQSENARTLADLNLKRLTDGLKDLNESIHELCVGEYEKEQTLQQLM